MPNEFKVVTDGNKTTLTFDGGLHMLEFVRDFVIPKAIRLQSDLKMETKFEYKIEGL